MLDDFLTAEQAATFINRSKSLICKLCVRGKLQGAERKGKKIWLIPVQSLKDYKSGLQGGAAVKARRESKREALRNEINAAIRQAKNVAQKKEVVQQ